MSGHETPISRVDRKKQARREALVQAALELLRERGLYGTRVEDITERADTAKGAFYNYFASKDALVSELLADAVEVLARDYLSLVDGASARTRVERAVKLHDQFLEEHPTYALLLHQTRGLVLVPASGDVEEIRAIFRRYLDVVADALAGGKALPIHRDVAAVVAGGVAGARAFNVAAGWEPSRVAPAVLARGAASALSAANSSKRRGRSAEKGRSA